MAQDRDSKKSPAEIYAAEVVRQQLAYWRDFASQVNAAKAQAQAAPQSTTTPATTGNVSAIVPFVAGALGLVAVAKLVHHHHKGP